MITGVTPVISYSDFINGDLKVSRCANRDCIVWTTAAVDSKGIVGFFTSIAIDSQEMPVISYIDGASGVFKVARCNYLTCMSP